MSADTRASEPLDLAASLVNGLLDTAYAMSDAALVAGLDERTSQYLLDRLAENPDLRPTLAAAARMRQTQPRRIRTEPTHVYFIQGVSSGLIKIGCAVDPNARLASLQTGSPDRLRLLATVEGDQALERELHERFAYARSHGEWFYPIPALWAYLQEESA